MLFLTDTQLLHHFISRGTALPFSLSTLRKDRINARLGGIPYRKIGGNYIYTPDIVLSFLAGIPIVQPSRSPSATKSKRGAPTKHEVVTAARLGISVSEMRKSGGAK